MLPVLRLGPFTLPVGPLALILAFYLALEIGDREGRRLGLRKDLISNAAVLSLLAGIVAARLAYVAANFSSYQLDWLQLFAVNLGTLDVTAGALLGLLAGYAYLQRRNVKWSALADALAPALALALAVLSLGNLLTGDAYGAVARDPTGTFSLPWAVFLWGEPRHPVQVYEMLAYLAIFAFLQFRAPRLRWFEGARFWLAIALLAGPRVLLEPFRGDSVAWVAGLRSMQIVALVVMTAAAAMLARGLSAAHVQASQPMQAKNVV